MDEFGKEVPTMESNVMTLIRDNRVTPQEVAGPSVCHHHWLIEAPNGQFSKGVCRNCQEVRQFRNSMRDADPVRQYGVKRFCRPADKPGILQPARKPIA